MGVTYGVGEEKGNGPVIHTANHPDPYCGSCIFRLGDQASKGKKVGSPTVISYGRVMNKGVSYDVCRCMQRMEREGVPESSIVQL